MPDKILIWAHRGASGVMPENTLAAFQKAIELGADGIELDIQLTRDGTIVVCHDETIDRTSNGTGFVKDYTLQQLRQFNFNKTHPEVEHADIPTMEEVFQLIEPTNLTINIELKTGVFDYKGMEEQICSMTHRFGMEDRVIYSSFNHYSIKRIQQIDPEAHTAFLYSDGAINIPEYGSNNGIEALHPWFVNLRYPNFMEKCRQRNLDVNVWTVDSEEYARMCAEAGVHAIITNYPDYIRSVLERTRLSEEYQEFIDGTIHPWLDSCVIQKDIMNPDGTRLRSYAAVNPEEKASIVMIHGFCEFFGKYHETAWRFYQEGYSVFFVELRGHGASGRNLPYGDSRIGVADFDEYVSDVETLVDQVVKPLSKTGKYYLFSHSMGGCIASMYLEKHPEVMTCAVLSSPMIKMNYGKIPGSAVRVLKVYSDIVRNDNDYAPGQSPFIAEFDIEKSCAMDPDRFNYQSGLRIDHEEDRTSGGTWGWVKAGMDAEKKVLKNAGAIRTPVLLCQAGNDTMVENSAQDRLARKIKHVKICRFRGAKHELFNATEEIREKWYRTLFRFYHHFDTK